MFPVKKKCEECFVSLPTSTPINNTELKKKNNNTVNHRLNHWYKLERSRNLFDSPKIVAHIHWNYPGKKKKKKRNWNLACRAHPKLMRSILRDLREEIVGILGSWRLRTLYGGDPRTSSASRGWKLWETLRTLGWGVNENHIDYPNKCFLFRKIPDNVGGNGGNDYLGGGWNVKPPLLVLRKQKELRTFLSSVDAWRSPVTSKWNPSLRAMARSILDETVLDSM